MRSSRRPTSTSRRRPGGNRSGSSCSRRWPPGPGSSAATSTATKASSRATPAPPAPPRAPKALAAAIGRLVADDELRARMAESGRGRAQEFSWERVTGKVEDYYGFVIRRLEAQGALPPGFHADIPPPGRLNLLRPPADAIDPTPAGRT